MRLATVDLEGDTVAQRFFPEDRVRLIDGGPVMSVARYDKTGRVVCRWYAPHEGWQERAFTEEELRVVRRARR